MSVTELPRLQYAIRNRQPRWAAAIAFVLTLIGPPVSAATPEEGYNEAQKIFVRGDVVGAMSLLRKAADAGHAPAQALLAQILDKAEFDKEAVEYFRKSALQGDADGEYGLGTMYAVGEGVPRDAQEASRWYRLAAGRGHEGAILVMALAYLRGDLGLTDRRRNDAQARMWIAAAAAKNNIQAMDGLAAALRSGDFGFVVDLAQAAEWEVKVKKLRVTKSSGLRKLK